MEKLDITQVCILCTKSIADGRIGDFFANRGAIKTYSGIQVGQYYFSDGRSIMKSTKMPETRKRINPWKKPRRKFPREMMVSNNNINWVIRMVYGKVKSENPYVAKLEMGMHDAKLLFGAWKFAKEIE